MIEGDIIAGIPMNATRSTGEIQQSARLRCMAESDATATEAPAYLEFATGRSWAVERMRITADGHVGIGTPAPMCSLDVAGPVRCGS